MLDPRILPALRELLNRTGPEFPDTLPRITTTAQTTGGSRELFALLAAGASLKCGDCHANQTDYTLEPDAIAHLEQWLAR